MAELSSVENKFQVEKGNLLKLGVEQFRNCHDEIPALNLGVSPRLEEIHPRWEFSKVEAKTNDVIVQLK